MTDSRARLFIRLLNHNLSEGRKRREDYLTEVFAFLLEVDTEARRALLGAEGLLLRGGRAGDGLDLASVEIRTQVALSTAERPDIEISDARGFRLLVESKVDAGFDPDQIARYLGLARPGHRDFVVSLVPSRGRPDGSALPSHDAFVGVVTWEEVAEVIDRLPPSGSDVDTFRLALRTLMASKDYRIAGPRWVAAASKDDRGRQDTGVVEELCDALDWAVDTVSQEFDRSGRKLPELYQPDASGLVFRPYPTSPARSGKGPSPRPILRHEAMLGSRTGMFGNLLFHVAFLPDADRDMTGLTLSMHYVMGRNVGATAKADVDLIQRIVGRLRPEAVSSLAGLDAATARARLGRLRLHWSEVLARTAVDTAQRLPELSFLPSVARKSAWGVAVDLVSTDTLLRGDRVGEAPGEVHPRAMAMRYAAVAGAALDAFLSRDDLDPTPILLDDRSAT